MKYLKGVLLSFAILLIPLGAGAAFNSPFSTPNYWKLTGGNTIAPINSSWNLQVDGTVTVGTLVVTVLETTEDLLVEDTFTISSAATSTGELFVYSGADTLSGDLNKITGDPLTATSTATVLTLEANGSNWETGARVLNIVTDDTQAIPLAINNGSGDVAYFQRTGQLFTSGGITLTSGGTITSTAAGNVTISPQGNGAVILGQTGGTGYTRTGWGSTSHSLASSSDLFVDGKLEVDGNAFFDENVSIDTGKSYQINEVDILRNDGTENIFVGEGAGASITTGEKNQAIGYQALNLAETTSYDTAIGYRALANDTGTGINVAIGWVAAEYLETGLFNVAVGTGAMHYVTGSSRDNVALGGNALAGVDGATSTANYNMAQGRGALIFFGNAEKNVAIGTDAGKGPAVDDYGDPANNVFIGYAAGKNNKGNNHILIGYQAGDNITTGNSNIIIGYDLDAPAADTSNYLNIAGIIYGSMVNGDISIVPNGTGITVIGDAGSTSHSLATNDDLFVSGELEVDGVTYFDNTVNLAGTTIIGQNTQFYSGTSYGSILMRNTAQTVNAPFLLTGATPNHIVIAEYADEAFDFSHAQQTNPTLFIHSANTSTDEWISFAHDQTDGVINVGTSSTKFLSGSTTSTVEIGATGQPGCLAIQDTDGAGFTYCSTLDGTMTCGMTSCK